MFGFHKIVGYINFYFLFAIFGTNQSAYIVNNFLLHLANVILVYLVARGLTKKPLVSVFAGVLFSHFYLSYFSNIHEYLVTFFSLLSIFLALQKNYKYSLFTFLLSLLSKEVGVFTFLFLLAAVPKKHWKLLKWHFLLALLYIAYQAFFALNGNLVPQGNSAYEFTTNPFHIMQRYIVFFNPLLITILPLVALIAKNKKATVLFVTSLISLLPFGMLASRPEIYYRYLPAAILAIGIAVLLAKLKTTYALLSTLLIIILFGGRAIFPPIAWDTFPNWEKESLQQVIGHIETALLTNPHQDTISLEGIEVKRDARLMLLSNTTHLFVAEPLQQFIFDYSPETNMVQVKNLGI